MLNEFKNRNVLSNYLIYLFLTFLVSFISYSYGFKFELEDYPIETKEYLSFFITFMITSLIFGVLITSPKKKYYPDDFSFIHLLKQVYNQKIGDSFLMIGIAFLMAPIIILMMMYYHWLQTLITLVILFSIIVFFYNYGFIFVLFLICLIFNMFHFSAIFVQEGWTPEEEIYTKKELNE